MKKSRSVAIVVLFLFLATSISLSIYLNRRLAVVNKSIVDYSVIERRLDELVRFRGSRYQAEQLLARFGTVGYDSADKTLRMNTPKYWSNPLGGFQWCVEVRMNSDQLHVSDYRIRYQPLQ